MSMNATIRKYFLRGQLFEACKLELRNGRVWKATPIGLIVFSSDTYLSNPLPYVETKNIAFFTPQITL